jgi:uncharacterized protein (TIRG00374 family)
LNNPEQKMRSEKREVVFHRLSWVWKPLASAVILGIIAMSAVTYFSSDKETWLRIQQFDTRYALSCFGLVLVAWLCNGIRLKMLSKSLGYKLSLARTTQVSLVSEFGIAATPAGSGSVILRAFLMRRLGVPVGTTLSMLATDGAMDASFFILMIPLALWPVLRGSSRVPAKIGPSLLILLALALIVAGLIYWFRRSRRRLDRLTLRPTSSLSRWRRRWRARRRLMRHRLTHALRDFRQGMSVLLRLRRSVLVAVFFMAVLQWLCRYGVLPVLLWGFGHSANPFPLFVLQGILFMAGLILVVPGGSGGIEVAFAIVMAPVIPVELIGVVLIMWRFFTYYLYLLGGGVMFATVPFTLPSADSHPVKTPAASVMD